MSFLALFENVFFVMSWSGTVVFLLYLLACMLAEPYLSLKWRYRILKTAILFYLLPIPLCRDYVRGFFCDHVAFVGETSRRQEPLVMNPDDAVAVHRHGAVFLMRVISFILVFKGILQYLRMKKMCFSGPGKQADGELQAMFSRQKARLNIRRDVKLTCLECCDSPMTWGVAAPVVIFPMWQRDGCVNEELCEAMLAHELVHIRHHDVLIKWAGALAAAVHWFNPFVYLFVRELSCVSEMYCDSVVMAGKGEDERRRYGELILRLGSGRGFCDREQFGAGFAHDGTLYKRRILEIKRSPKYKPFFSAVTAVLICAVGFFSVFAYDPPDAVTEDGKENVYDPGCEEEQGNGECIHDLYDRRTASVHERDGHGGCTVKYYDVRRCRECGNSERGEVAYTAVYETCHHE